MGYTVSHSIVLFDPPNLRIKNAAIYNKFNFRNVNFYLFIQG